MNIQDNNILRVYEVASNMDSYDDWVPIEDFEKLLDFTDFELDKSQYPRLLDYLLTLPKVFDIRMEDLKSRRPKAKIVFIGEPILPPVVEPETVEEEEKIVNSRKVLESISNGWKLEAKLERQKDYFYHLTEVNSILRGDKCYIIGRKGTGKSMISEYLNGLADQWTFTQKLSFKNFPFNFLYELKNENYTGPNQYITIWKYLIYSTIAKLMSANESIDKKIRQDLENTYGSRKVVNLSRTVKEWTSLGFNVNIAGYGGGFNMSRNDAVRNYTWRDHVDILEDVILNHCDSSRYFVIFDELDEDYRDIKGEDYVMYKNLLTSLFKAVQDIKGIFSDSTLNIMPVIFLRDDIYSLIKDADKNKWRDLKIEIEWSKDKIKQLLAFRISKDLGSDFPLLFRDAWGLICSQEKIKARSGKGDVDTFDYIAKSTHLRPRDFIRYLQVCAEHTISHNRNEIDNKTIKFVDRAFSNYLKDEIIDEIYPLLPDVETIFQVIGNIRKWIFSIDEFKEEYQSYVEANSVEEKNTDYILDILYRFSVVGTQSRYQHKGQHHYFKYLHTNMNLNKKENLVLHRGLFKSLQIV